VNPDTDGSTDVIATTRDPGASDSGATVIPDAAADAGPTDATVPTGRDRIDDRTDSSGRIDDATRDSGAIVGAARATGDKSPTVPPSG
jgi:hypothetical protein